MSSTSYVIQINAGRLEKPEKPTAILACFQKDFRVSHRSQNLSGFPVFILSGLK